MADFGGVAAAALANAGQQKQKRPGGQFQQNLSGAQNGAIQGAHGGTQQLGEAARRRLGAQGPNPAGGGLNPTPPTMDPAQKPPAWQALQQAGSGGQGSAAANRAAAAALPGFQPMPMPRPAGGDLQIMDGAPGTVAFPGSGGPGPSLGPVTNYGPANVDGHPGANPDAVAMMGGEGNIQNALRKMGGDGPLPGFTAAPGVNWNPGSVPGLGSAGPAGPLMSLPGPTGKFPPRPGLPTKPLPMPTPGTPQVRPGFGGGGLSPSGPRPRNNMASY